MTHQQRIDGSRNRPEAWPECGHPLTATYRQLPTVIIVPPMCNRSADLDKRNPRSTDDPTCHSPPATLSGPPREPRANSEKRLEAQGNHRGDQYSHSSIGIRPDRGRRTCWSPSMRSRNTVPQGTAEEQIRDVRARHRAEPQALHCQQGWREILALAQEYKAGNRHGSRPPSAS